MRRLLAFHFKGKKAYRLGTPEAAKYKQVVLLGTRRTRRECNQLSDADLIKAQNLIAEMSHNWEHFPSSLTLPVQSTRFQKADLSS